MIKNSKHVFKFDSGSTISAISVSDFNQNFPSFNLCSDSMVTVTVPDSDPVAENVFIG